MGFAVAQALPKGEALCFRHRLHFIQESLDLIQLILRHGAAGIVDPAQLGGVALHSADLQRDRRADDKVPAGGFLHGDVGERLVVPLVAVGHRRHEGRVAQIPRPDGRKEGIFLFYEAFGLGQDDDVALVAQTLEEADGDGVSYAAVQKGIVADPDALAASGMDAEASIQRTSSASPVRHLW